MEPACGGAPPDDTLDTADKMALWSPRVRANIVHFDLVSSIRFLANKTDNDGVKVQYAEPSIVGCNLKYHQIVKLNRTRAADLVHQQLPHVRGYADLRRDRFSEILSQMSDIGAFFAGIGFLHRERTRFTIELLAAMQRAMVVIEMRAKHAVASPRPAELSAQVDPMIPTPGHGAYPSGHAAEAFLMAAVLAHLSRPQDMRLYGDQRVMRRQLMRSANRIAVNRVVAGVHFPVESAAGQVMGLAMARFFLALCKGPGQHRFRRWRFKPSAFADSDHDWREIDEAFAKSAELHYLRLDEPSFTVRHPADGDPRKPLVWLYRKAREEWR